MNCSSRKGQRSVSGRNNTRRVSFKKFIFVFMILTSSSSCDRFDRSFFQKHRRRTRKGANDLNIPYEEWQQIAFIQEEEDSSSRPHNEDGPKLVQRIWKLGTRTSMTAVVGVRAKTPPPTSLLRGGQQQLGDIDRKARIVAIFLAWIVSLQAIGTTVRTNRDHLFELASRLMGRETISAAKHIKTILTSVTDDHGVIHIFEKYPMQDIFASIFALSRIQSACEQYEYHKQSTITKTKDNNDQPMAEDFDDNRFPDEHLLDELRHYAPFAAAAYGWTMDLATAGKLHRGDHRALVKMTGLDEDDIIDVNWESKTNLPAYFIVRDTERKRIVLSIRGTWGPLDVLTDLCCTSEEYFVGRRHHKAHTGMLMAARGISSMAEEIVKGELENNPDYSLLLVGHSLGGSVAAVLGNLWSQQFEGTTVYSYGPACVSPENDRYDDCCVVSVLIEGDPFSCLSLGHVADVSCALAHLCDDPELRSTILMRTDSPIEERDLQWCSETMKEIQANMSGDKLYPPGRLLFIAKNTRSSRGAADSIREVPTDFFQTLKVGPRMFDLSRHVPRLYETRLRQCYPDYN